MAAHFWATRHRSMAAPGQNRPSWTAGQPHAAGSATLLLNIAGITGSHSKRKGCRHAGGGNRVVGDRAMDQKTIISRSNAACSELSATKPEEPT